MEDLHSSGCHEKSVLELSNHGAIVSSTLPSDEPYLKVQILADLGRSQEVDFVLFDFSPCG